MITHTGMEDNAATQQWKIGISGPPLLFIFKVLPWSLTREWKITHSGIGLNRMNTRLPDNEWTTDIQNENNPKNMQSERKYSFWMDSDRIYRKTVWNVITWINAYQLKITGRTCIQYSQLNQRANTLYERMMTELLAKLCTCFIT